MTAFLGDTRAPASARLHALWTLDAVDKGEFARNAIMLAANDPDPSVRRQAIRQLGTRRAREAAPLLISKLNDADASVRFQAATALGRIGEPSAISPLVAALDDPDFFARYAVFTALNRIGRADHWSWPAIAKGLEAKPTSRRSSERWRTRCVRQQGQSKRAWPRLNCWRSSSARSPNGKVNGGLIIR
ncbi:MAG: hypothetical protein DME18_06330 [Verrucomicrobia bacterium]|nr:MAG: hypothetical protein DME18_06330 [Verrucomicrobiota bacterium]